MSDLDPTTEESVEAVETGERSETVEAPATDPEAAVEPAAPAVDAEPASDDEPAVDTEPAADPAPVTEVPEAPIEPDPVLLAARDRAREALAEITDPKTIGADEGHEVHGEHVLSLFFECRLAGYPGWHWTATLARVDETSEINVLEVELLPGAGAVVAPEWVPWSDRLAQYRETQAKQAADEAAAAEDAAEELAEEDELDPEQDPMENDFSDFDDEIDGVDLESDEDDEDSDDEDDAGFDDDDLDDDEDDEFDHLDDDSDHDIETLTGIADGSDDEE
ncbi:MULTISPECIES: DUF3027 domain-containing protein [unclassified Leucobacter]|uniref:DUF3027 domain-containing protein n=1 Tax=unclassified Leucobacter TaxID=2621730 RepID=UPI000A07C2AC|nr:DUF3027 domain-containing protein [Leucobacter sp. Ag1]